MSPMVVRTSWATILLASYASAITLGLAWTLIKDRTKRRPCSKSSRPDRPPP